MNNPLLEDFYFPPFSKIQPQQIEIAIDQRLAEAREIVADCLAKTDEYNWENLIAPIETAEDRLHRSWSPVSHLNAVLNSEELRQAYNACLPKLDDYATEMGQNKALFKAYQSIIASENFAQLMPDQQRFIHNQLRDFHLSGIDLSAELQQRYKEISQQLSKLSSTYEEHVLDATQAWSKLITDVNELAGLPESALAQAEQLAAQQQQKGWLINLQFPSYYAVMTYADNRELRYQHYYAYTTRASELGEHPEWNNSPIMQQILALRHEMAQLLGFTNYAELSLATKMAKNPLQVMDFLQQLTQKVLPQARAEFEELQQFAQQYYHIEEIKAWDMMYLAEKLRQYRYQLSQEEIRAYFPLPKVLSGLFIIVEKLYGLQIQEINEFDQWHPDARLFVIHDQDNQLRGYFYLDLYARAHKRGGAWMDNAVDRRQTDKGIQIPIAYLVCNFTPPMENEPALLTHDEVQTLFHEFGHGLHHLMTQINYAGVSGIHGVEWDAVELPSQFMENWCWEKEALHLISAHYQTGEVLPNELLNKLVELKNFHSGLMMIRQLEYSLIDFRLHQEFNPNQADFITEMVNSVRQQTAVILPPDFNRFIHSFSHIFAGGYAAGYYSYKWAEVLSSDAYSLFEQQGIFNRQTGLAFLTAILEKGGSAEAMQLFKDFRGREPEMDAFLRHNGVLISA